MLLPPGTRLGPYEIQASIGAGGKREVYRANDTPLDRTVAIKVLPQHLAGRPERRQRFEREARAISSVHHSHICILHDIGRRDPPDPGRAQARAVSPDAVQRVRRAVFSQRPLGRLSVRGRQSTDIDGRRNAAPLASPRPGAILPGSRRQPDGRGVREGERLEAGEPRALFRTRTPPAGSPTSRTNFAVAADGRFLVNAMAEDAGASPITVAVNWTAGLKR